MSERIPSESWEEEFSNYIPIKDKIFDRLIGKDRSKLNKERIKSFIYGYKPPYGLGNIWGVGVGYKGFLPADPSDPRWWDFWDYVIHRKIPYSYSSDEIERLLRNFEFKKCIKIFVGKKADKDGDVEPSFLISNVKDELGYSDVTAEVVEINQFRPSSTTQVITPTSGGNITLSGGTIGSIIEGPQGSLVMLSSAHVFVDLNNQKEIKMEILRTVIGRSNRHE